MRPRRTRTGGLVALVLAGCGRMAFDPVGDAASADGSPTDAGGDALESVCASSRLVAHWRLDETTGTAIVDSAGSSNGVWTDSNDGNVSGEATTGRSGGALRFETGSSVLMAGFVVPAEGTFSAWLTSAFDDSAAPGGNHPMVIDTPPPRTTISYAGDIGEYGLRTNDVSWQASDPIPSDLTGWFHLTGTWSATGARLYLDGVPLSAQSATDARSTSPPDLYLGTREQGQRWWDGLIDDVRIYDYPMSASEVAELHACP